MHEYASEDDEVYAPDTPNVTPEMEHASSKTLSGIQTLLGTSPVKFQVKRKFVESLGDSSIRYLQKKWKETIAETMNKFVESVAPGQGDTLRSMLNGDSSDSDE